MYICIMYVTCLYICTIYHLSNYQCGMWTMKQEWEWLWWKVIKVHGSSHHQPVIIKLLTIINHHYPIHFTNVPNRAVKSPRVLLAKSSNIFQARSATYCTSGSLLSRVTWVSRPLGWNVGTSQTGRFGSRNLGENQVSNPINPAVPP